MKLSAWLEKKRMSPAEFAERIGVNRSTVGRWLKEADDPDDISRPDWDLIPKIIEVTNGDVTANDFVGVGEQAA